MRHFCRFGATPVLALSLAAASACGGSSPLSPDPSTVPPTTVSGPPAVLVGAGDIGLCGSAATAATAALLDRIDGTVYTTGDNAYPNGSEENFRDCYDPHWGRHRGRTRPTPGNHEYMTAGGAPYFTYFGASAGPPARGYYAYRAGSWLVLALNSEIPAGAGSAQVQWLRGELSRASGACTLVYWHRPLFSSGPHGPDPAMRDVWRVLHEYNADVVLTGHEHMYERFAPQDQDGRADAIRGIRQFIVGTGGAALYSPNGVAPNSEVVAPIHGVLKLTLSDGAYFWEFVPIPGATFRDSGSGICH